MKKYFLTALILLIISVSSFPLTWKEALTLAEKNSKEIAGAKKQLEASEWSYRKAFSSILPQLSASAGMSENTADSTTEVSRSYSSAFSVSQTLFSGLENIYNIQSAYADLEYQKATLLSVKTAYYYDLRSAYIDALVAQENVGLSRQILKQRKQNTKLIQLRYDSGREDQGNLLTTKADQANSEHDYSAARRDLKLSLLKLSQLLGKDVLNAESDTKFSSAGEPDLDQVLRSTPTYIIQQKQLELAEISKNKNISEYLPSISLSASRRSTGDEWPPNTGSNSWGWNLSYSFLPGGSNIADSFITGSQLDAARYDFEVSIKQLRYDLENALLNYTNALELLDVAKIQLAAAKERVDISQAKYMNGLVAYDEWYRIENTYIQAQKGLLSAERTTFLAEAAWHKSYGGWIK